MRSVWLGAALVCILAQMAAADPQPGFCAADNGAVAATPVAWSLPPPPAEPDATPLWDYAAFRGLSCAACNPARHFCVLNPMRYEYACAPLGAVACISASRTHWCPASRGCWAGVCR